jgi:hypothetical protein
MCVCKCVRVSVRVYVWYAVGYVVNTLLYVRTYVHRHTLHIYIHARRALAEPRSGGEGGEAGGDGSRIRFNTMRIDTIRISLRIWQDDRIAGRQAGRRAGMGSTRTSG